MRKSSSTCTTSAPFPPPKSTPRGSGAPRPRTAGTHRWGVASARPRGPLRRQRRADRGADSRAHRGSTPPRREERARTIPAASLPARLPGEARRWAERSSRPRERGLQRRPCRGPRRCVVARSEVRTPDGAPRLGRQSSSGPRGDRPASRLAFGPHRAETGSPKDPARRYRGGRSRGLAESWSQEHL